MVYILLGDFMEFIEQNIQLLAIVFGGSFLTMFIAAATNKVTVFKDYGDLWSTLGLIIWPAIGIGVIVYLGEQSSAQIITLNDLYFGSSAATATTAATGLITLFCLYKTFMNAITSNGLVIGLIVGIFKVLSSIIIIFSIFGFINRITEKNKSLGSTLIFITIFTIVFKWILDVLVNGHKVEAKSLANQQ